MLRGNQITEMIDSEERVVLVDDFDIQTGTADKLEAHRTGALHRAFSVFIFDAGNRMLLQRRASSKYHSPGLWSNACCGHPRPGEGTDVAAARRLNEELGITTALQYASAFTYRAALRDGLVEHEIDHVYTGRTSDEPHPDPTEIDEVKWMTTDDVRAWLARDPGAFTAWFSEALDCISSTP